MTVEQFEQISLLVLVTGLIGFMGFIVYDLAKKSQAGRFGTLILFGALGAGSLVFLIKTILVEVLNL